MKKIMNRRYESIMLVSILILLSFRVNIPRDTLI